MRATCHIAVVLLLSAAGCTAGDRSPVGAVREFLKQSSMLNSDQAVFDLLGPKTRARLEQVAGKTTTLMGGRRRVTAAKMFLLGLADPPYKVGKITLQRKQGDRAWVKLEDKKKKYTEIWQLVKVDGRWRIELPDKPVGG